LVKFKIITARSGLTTIEKILALIENSPNGISITEISKEINRPVSMISICLKSLISEKKVKAKLSKNGRQRIYSSICILK
jgi:DNA-binding IclR family transcriptional regulator